MIAFLSRSQNCSKFAFTHAHSHAHNRTQVRKRPFCLLFVFLWKVVPWRVGFYYNSIWFIFFSSLHAFSLSFSRALSFYKDSYKKTIVRLCVCFIVLHLRVAVLVLFWVRLAVWVCGCVFVCCSIKSLIWYKFYRYFFICFLFIFVKIHYDFSLLSFMFVCGCFV